jgi:competence protein ComEA
VDLSGRKMRFALLVSGAAIVMLILVWRFVQGGAASIQGGFVPVNEQMQELLNRQSEDPGAKVDKNTVGSKDAKISTNVQGGKDSNEVKDSKDAKDAKDAEDAKDVKGIKDVQGANESVDLKIQESQASFEHPATEATKKLNINTATWEQLDKLPGIGESKAKAIIAYRGEKGYFRKIEDLAKVKGIGDKMVVKLKAYIYASAP